MLDPNCSYCQSIIKAQTEGTPIGEKYSWMCGYAVYDIDKAREFVKDGRQVHEFPTEQLDGFVDYSDDPTRFKALTTCTNWDHIDHVSDSKDDPIIVALSLKPRTKDESKRFHLPIDGHHRIAKAIKHKQPIVYGVVLTEEETDQILTDNRGPAKRTRKKK